MSGASKSSQVEDTIKDMWATRPRRPRRGRKVAGVAAGIGERYGIDPVIPRVLFAVLSFYGGAGVLLYVLGWLLLPEEDDEVSPVESLAGKGRSATSGLFTILLILALIPLFGWFFDKDFGGFFGLLVGAGVLFLLHRGRSHLGKVPQPPAQQTYAPEHATGYPLYPSYPAYQTAGESYQGPAAAPGQAAPTDTFSASTHGAPSSSAAAPSTPAGGSPTSASSGSEAPMNSHHAVDVEQPPTPPAWDPLGAAPFAWDLPEPARHEPEPDAPAVVRKRSKAGLVTVGVALLAVGGLVLAGPVLGGWVSVPHIIGVVLGVLGLGMFLGAFRGGGAGLIGLAAPLAAVGIVLTVVWPNGWEGSGGLGDLQARPTTLEQVQPVYARNVGSVDLDLTALPDSGSVTTKAVIDVGDVTVIVPENADLVVRCSSGLGEVFCLHESRGGSAPSVELTDYGPDGPGGLKIELHAETSGPGNVEVIRG
ncbi:PspC domain-containing protein [Actinokineospora guangxiensis]|uniref:PspC domain-containing protein n=1 Tax=Actinokineospora guangxiensis TaxID=1490288 RepID=A0ABW0EFI1_9PSEU